MLACGKCQKKLKRSKGAKLSKALKRRGPRDREGLKLRVVEVACLKMCPKGGITVCTQGQIGRNDCGFAVRTIQSSTLDDVEGETGQ